MANIVYLVKRSYEVYGPFNEQNQKELISSTDQISDKAFTTEEKAKDYIRKELLETEARWIESFIGRKPDVAKEEETELFNTDDTLWGAYVAWNLSEDDAKKVEDIFLNAVPGGAIEIYVTYGGVELVK